MAQDSRVLLDAVCRIPTPPCRKNALSRVAAYTQVRHSGTLLLISVRPLTRSPPPYEARVEYIIPFWILCGIAGAGMLSRYGKAGSGFLLGLLLGPIGLIIAWTMRDTAKLDEAKSSGAAPGSAEDRVERECPHCAERILVKAKVCKHCGREVEPFV